MGHVGDGRWTLEPRDDAFALIDNGTERSTLVADEAAANAVIPLLEDQEGIPRVMLLLEVDQLGNRRVIHDAYPVE